MGSGPFEHYPVSPSSIDETGQEINASAAPMRSVAHEAGELSLAAKRETEGFLFEFLGRLREPLFAQGDALHKAAAYAGAVVRTWALAVQTYNGEIDKLNKEYADAKATSFGVEEPMMRGGQTTDARNTMWDNYADDIQAGGDAKLAELTGRKKKLDADLDDGADDLAARLNRPPTDDDWTAFDAVGVLPDAFQGYVPPPPAPPEPPPEESGFSKFFKTFIFDPSQCGGDGSILGCGIEVAGIIPAGKILKGGKLAKKGIDGLDDANDARKAGEAADDLNDAKKAYDAARDAEKAAEAARKELQDKFKDGAVPKATELKDYAEKQGWKLKQNPDGPPTYVDENGVKRITIKQGTPRAPGSEHPHVEMRDSSGQRIDPNGNPTTRKDPGNHAPIDWDLD